MPVRRVALSGETLSKLKAKLRKGLPKSLRMLSTIQLHERLQTPGLEVYQPSEVAADDENAIIFSRQYDDNATVDYSVGIYCSDNEAQVEKVVQYKKV